MSGAGGTTIRTLLKVAVSAGVLAVLVQRVEGVRMVEALGRLRPALFASVVALYVGGQLLSAAKWALAGAALGFRRRYREYARFYFVGMFVNLFGPGTVGGDVARALLLGGGTRRARAATSVVFDRASGLLVLVGIGLAALATWPGYVLPPVVARLAAGIFAVLLVSWVLVPRLATVALPAGHRIRRFLVHDLQPLRGDPALLLRVAVLSAAFHLVEVTAQYVLARAVGLDVPYAYCLIFHPAVTVAAAAPVSVAGLGVREGGYVFFLGLVGIAPEAAFTMGLLWSLVVLLGSLGGGVLLLGRPEERVGALRPPTACGRDSDA